MCDVIAIPSAVKTEIEETDALKSISAQPPELGMWLQYHGCSLHAVYMYD